MEQDLFELDEFSGPQEGASFVTSRFGEVRREEDDSVGELDDLRAAEPSAEDLRRLLETEGKKLEAESVSKSLTARFCSYLVSEEPADAVLEQVKQFGRQCMNAVAKLREDWARFDLYAVSVEKTQLEVEIEQLENEAATWELVAVSLADLRSLTGKEQTFTQLHAVAKDEWVSDESFFQQACSSDLDMRRWKRIVNWLERVYSSQQAASAGVRTEEYWGATSHALAQGLDMENDRPLVSRIDPDAPIREKVRKLHSLDENVDSRLLKRVWELVRGGKIGAAIAECNACHQQWRSATLMGMQSYHDPKVVHADDPRDARGNSNTANLRMVCAKLAESAHANVHEKALYGLFAGSVAPAMAVSQSPHDRQWVLCKVNLLQKMMQYRGLAHNEILTDEEILQQSLVVDQHGSSLSDIATMFLQVQRAIILNELNELVDMMTVWQQSEHINLRRFAVHLLIVLGKVGAPYLNPQPDLLLRDGHVAICKYVESVVTGLDLPATVAALALHLPEAERVRCVSKFIAHSVEGGSLAQAHQQLQFAVMTQIEEQRAADRKQVRRLRHIQAIEASGMKTIEILMQVVLNLLPPADVSVKAYNFGDNVLVGSHAFERDFMGSHVPLVEVLGWLTIRVEHWKESVLVANQIARNLALRHRVSDMKDVLRALPDVTLEQCRRACLQPNRAENGFAFEIEYWRTLCDAYDMFAVWQTSRMNPDTAFDDLESLYAGCEANLRRVIDFPASPLFVDIPESNNDLRELQLFVIRDAFIPQVFFMLHYLHHNMQRYNQALALADDVADQRRQFWTVFARNRRLERFLSLMKDSSVAILALNHSDILGYDV